MKTYHFETSAEDEQTLGSAGQLVTGNLRPDNASEFADAEAISVFVNSVVTPEIIDALPNLKLIVTRSTGYDHIDHTYAANKGIAVSYVPAYGSRTVAEFAFALILGLSRKTFQANLRIKNQQDFHFEGFEGFNLQGKTLGIIGTGRIGQEVAKIAKGFEMNILAFDAFPNQDAASQLGFKYTELESLLKQSDIVTIHVPYMKETHHLINQDNISVFKKGAILINTARGEIVDTSAILKGLDEGFLSAAGLDVLEGEHDLKDEMQIVAQGENVHKDKLQTLLKDHILMQRPEVVITPHMAFFTKEAKDEIAKTTLENIASFEAGEAKNLVKP